MTVRKPLYLAVGLLLAVAELLPAGAALAPIEDEPDDLNRALQALTSAV